MLLQFYIEHVLKPVDYCVSLGVYVNNLECSTYYWYGILTLSFAIAAIVSVVLNHTLLKFLSKRLLWQLSNVLILVGCMFSAISSMLEEWASLTFMAFFGFAVGIQLFSIKSLLADCTDYAELVLGNRNEGLV